MQLFHHSQGFIFAFGFDMLSRKPMPRRVAWCDPLTHEWEAKPTNSAGYVDLHFDIAPEFIRECKNNVVVAYQPSRCVEFVYCGAPYVWSVLTLQTDHPAALAA